MPARTRTYPGREAPEGVPGRGEAVCLGSAAEATRNVSSAAWWGGDWQETDLRGHSGVHMQAVPKLLRVQPVGSGKPLKGVSREQSSH